MNQDYSNLEVWVIDDGSTDGSAEICDKVASEDQRIQVIHKQNGGVSSARNKGIELSQGTFCCFIDGDDYLSPDYISKMIAAFGDYACDMVCCGCWRERLDGTFVWHKQIPVTTCFNQKQSIIETLKPNSYLGWPWNKMFRLSVIKNNGIRYDETLRYCEDELFVLTYLSHASSTVYLSDTLYHYMDNPLSVNLKMYAKRKFNTQCLDRHKADEISARLLSNFHDSEIDEAFKARRFLSYYVTMHKLMSNYSGENDIYIQIRSGLRKYYMSWITNKHFIKPGFLAYKFTLLTLNPKLYYWLSKRLNFSF
jgi:glycosyltransferase involved in cell wall biosynthesis